MSFFKKIFGIKNNPSETIDNHVKSVVSSSGTSDFFLDCKNLNCPMPIVKISKQFRDMKIGQTLEVVATDPAFRADIEAWIRSTGNELITFEDGVVRKAVVKKINEIS